ncbi:3,4-dihydroxy 2-butanone 4-phosphate synthase [Hanseniaspora osmophila]
MSNKANFSPIEEAIEDFKQNKFLIVMDDESRENEGDLIIPAHNITSQQMAFIVKYTSGYICAPMTNSRADKLDLPLMSTLECAGIHDKKSTAYTMTVDAAKGTTTGISSSDRSLTCRNLADFVNINKPTDFIKPGHIVPLRAVDGGVVKRGGHTEAAVDLCRLSGLPEVGVIGELVREDDGEMMRLKECVEFSEKHNIKIITVEQLISYIKSQN